MLLIVNNSAALQVDEQDKHCFSTFASTLFVCAARQGVSIEKREVKEVSATVFELKAATGKHLGSILLKGIRAEAVNSIGISCGFFAANGFGAEKAFVSSLGTLLFDSNIDASEASLPI